jgi:hypothetical protein
MASRLVCAASLLFAGCDQTPKKEAIEEPPAVHVPKVKQPKWFVDYFAKCEHETAEALNGIRGNIGSCKDIKIPTKPGEPEFVYNLRFVPYVDQRFVISRVRLKSQIPFFCKRKVIWESVARELDNAIEMIPIPPEESGCHKLVAMHRSGFGSRSVLTDLDEHQRNLLVVRSLELFKYVHSRGMTLESFDYFFSKDGQVRFTISDIGAINSKLLTIPKVNLINLALVAASASFVEKRGDMEDYYVSDLKDPVLLLLHAVMKTPTDSKFDYDFWISAFQRNNFEAVPPLSINYPNTPMSDAWWTSFDQCVQTSAGLLPEDCLKAKEECRIGRNYILSKGAVPLVVTKLRRSVGSRWALWFETSEKDVNIFFPLLSNCNSSVRVACTQKTSLTLLKRLKMFELRPHALPVCSALAVAMETFEGIDAGSWIAEPEPDRPSNKAVLEYLKQGLTLLKQIHSKGLSLNLGYYGAFLVQGKGADLKVDLADFGETRPLMKGTKPFFSGKHAGHPIRADMGRVIDPISYRLYPILEKSPSLEQALKIYMEIGLFELPDYDRLIALVEAAKNEIAS